MSTTAASGGCSDPPDLHPPDITESVTIVCPDCAGFRRQIVEHNCCPTITRPCVTCTETGRIKVYWASSREDPDHSRRTHLVQVGTAPAECLCDHDPIPCDQLAGFSGLPCWPCLNTLNRMDTVDREARLTAESEPVDD